MLIFFMALISCLGTGLPVRSTRALTSPSVSNWSRVVLSNDMVVDGEDMLEKEGRERRISSLCGRHTLGQKTVRMLSAVG